MQGGSTDGDDRLTRREKERRIGGVPELAGFTKPTPSYEDGVGLRHIRQIIQNYVE